MGLKNQKRAEQKELLVSHPVAQREELPDEMRALLQELDEKLGRRPTSRRRASNPRAARESSVPAAGPHACGDLTNAELTPGTGMLPDPDADDPNPGPTS